MVGTGQALAKEFYLDLIHIPLSLSLVAVSGPLKITHALVCIYCPKTKYNVKELSETSYTNKNRGSTVVAHHLPIIDVVSH